MKDETGNQICHSCMKPYIGHLGINGTCAELVKAKEDIIFLRTSLAAKQREIHGLRNELQKEQANVET